MSTHTTAPAAQDTQSLLEALKAVAVALKGRDLPFALAGGFAVYARGGQDSRHDVDFVLPEAEAAEARQALEDAGLTIEEPPEDWLFKARCGDAPVDLIFRLANGPVDGDLLGRADELAVESVRMPVLSATDLLASKLASLSEHNCNFEPVLALMRSLREQIDLTIVERECEHRPFAAAALFLARRLEILPAAHT
jgi:hypothetical protein